MNESIGIRRAKAPLLAKYGDVRGGKRQYSQHFTEEEFTDHLPETKRARLDVLLEDSDLSPESFAMKMCLQNGFNPEIKCSVLCGCFKLPTEEEIAAYDLDALKAVKDQDLDELRRMVASGRTIQCSNRFGESLLHMACRRGFTQVVRFMVEQAGVSVYVRDDYGRLPMHDACWSPEPNFDVMEILIRESPEQIFLSDVRGHTPFSYVRKEHWKQWKKFLSDRQHLLQPKTCSN